jgi:arylsulfatase A-like enzyme
MAGVAVTLLLAIAMGATLLIGCSQHPRPNVLFITMDSLRHDHLGCTGYRRAHTPNIDALAEDGTVFMEAIAQGTYTTVSVPSIVSGQYPFFNGIRTFRGELDSAHTTLAEVLSADRYSTFVTSQRWSKSFYQGFDKFGVSSLSTTKRTESTIQAFQEHKGDKFFIWLYYWDPHAPYAPPEEFMRLYEPDYAEVPLREQMTQGRKSNGVVRDYTGHYNGSITTLIKLNTGKIQLSALDREYLLNLYDAEIAYVDAEIGRVVAKLKQMGLYDNTMIVLNADHGEGFGEHDKYYHGMTVYDEMARVPLIIKPPHSRDKNKVVWGQVRNIDIMPTILDYCGLAVPTECNGQSLRPFIEDTVSPDLPAITETHGGKHRHLVAFRHQNHKLIYDLKNDKAWLYDLQTDPGEKNSLLPEAAPMQPAPEENLSPARQKEQAMRQELLNLLGLKQLAGLAVTEKGLKEIDEKTKDQLKALGYVY